MLHMEGEMIEIWRIAREFPEYAVSNRGRVKRVKRQRKDTQIGKILKCFPDRRGYLRIRLFNGYVLQGKRVIHTHFVHRLVCDAFHGSPKGERTQTRHLDGINTNNCAENLAWGTHSENMEDMVRHGSTRGERNGNSVLDDLDVLGIRQLYSKGYLQREIAMQYDVSITSVSRIVRRKVWRHI